MLAGDTSRKGIKSERAGARPYDSDHSENWPPQGVARGSLAGERHLRIAQEHYREDAAI